MKNRYIFFKRLFKDCIIIFKIKDKYTSIGIDKLLIPYLRKNNINYIIIDEDNEVTIIKNKKNDYCEIYKKIYLKEKIIEILNNYN